MPDVFEAAACSDLNTGSKRRGVIWAAIHFPEHTMPKRVTVVKESDSGRNEKFRDNRSGTVMSRPEFVRKIEHGDYDKYHVRIVHGVKTPVSNPDGSEGNNLE